MKTDESSSRARMVAILISREAEASPALAKLLAFNEGVDLPTALNILRAAAAPEPGSDEELIEGVLSHGSIARRITG